MRRTHVTKTLLLAIAVCVSLVFILGRHEGLIRILSPKSTFISVNKGYNMSAAVSGDDNPNQREYAKPVTFPWKPVKMEHVNCAMLFDGDPAEHGKAKRLQELLSNTSLPATNISRLAAADCPQLLQTHGFITDSLTREEEEFPIAFSILVFKHVEQVVTLLRAVYRPQNYYCLHVDSKSQSDFRQSLVALSTCLPNVFLASRSVSVQWGRFTVLEPEIICMQDLWRFKTWKYFINLTGQEFPLRTNWELVQILKAYNGANNLEGTIRRMNKGRFHKAGAPPGGLKLTKGSVHVTVNRDFVDFVLHNQLSRDLLNWSRKVQVPDETFFSTINHNPQLGIKGTYLGKPETHADKYPFLNRFKNWGDFPCAGKYVRNICILTTGDLPLLKKRPELFVNKLHAGYSQIAQDCLAERIYNTTRDEFLGLKGFNASYYANMPFVSSMVKESTFKRNVQTPI